MCLQLWDEHFVLVGALLNILSDTSTSLYFCEYPISKQNLLCLLSRVSVTPFTTTPSDIFGPPNLPSSVFQKCSRLWHNGRIQREWSRVRLPGRCGDGNVTSPSLRPEDSCGPYTMMNGCLCAQVEQLSAECSSKCIFTAPKLRWVSLTVCSLVLQPGTHGAWECSFLIGQMIIQDITRMLLHPTSTSTD